MRRVVVVLVSVGVAVVPTLLGPTARAEVRPRPSGVGVGVATAPARPEPTRRVSQYGVPGGCTAGWHWTTTSNRANYLSADYRTSTTNDLPYSASATFTSNATSTYTWSTGASFEASARALIFAEVKATVNASISRSRTSTYGESVTTRVPAHHTVHGDHGKLIEYLYGYGFYLYRNCTRSPLRYSTVRAPYRVSWHVY